MLVRVRRSISMVGVGLLALGFVKESIVGFWWSMDKKMDAAMGGCLCYI